MKPLQIIEVFNKTYDSASGLIHTQLKITNISSDYVNNLKLIIEDQEHVLLEQQITRERGSLSFSSSTTCLDLGNLAPDESAFFDYKYNATTLSNAFTNHISLTYGDFTESLLPEKKVVEFLVTSDDSKAK